VGAEAGFALVELLVVCVVFTFVLTAILVVFDSVYRNSHKDEERNTSLVEQTAALHRMVTELRQAYRVIGPVSGTSSNYMDVLVRITGSSGTQDRRVLYRCDSAAVATGLEQCVRYEFAATDPSPAGSAPSGSAPTIAIPRLSNGTAADPVFTNLSSPNGTGGGPTYGQATIKTPGAGERTTGYAHQLVLSDGFWMRNRDIAH
jgi:type II secretory pathway pseudopilin PulG